MPPLAVAGVVVLAGTLVAGLSVWIARELGLLGGRR